MTRTRSGLPGIYNSTPLTLADGDGAAVALDSTGRVLTSVAQALTVSSTNVASSGQNFTSATKALLKNTPGNVLAIYATNANVAIRYIQIFNKATAPIATDVPIASFVMPGASGTSPATIILGTDFFTTTGRYCSLGIGWAVSTTPYTFTDAATGSEHLIDTNFI